MKMGRAAAYIGTGIAVYAGLKYLLAPMIPFLIGWGLAAALAPLTAKIYRRFGIRQEISGAVMIAGLTAALALGLWRLAVLLLGQLRRLGGALAGMESFPQICLDRCCAWVSDATGWEDGTVRRQLILYAGRLRASLLARVGEAGTEYALDFLGGVVALAGGALVAVLFGVLIIRDVEGVRDRLSRLAAGRCLLAFGRRLRLAGGRYLRAQFLLLLAVTGVCCAGLALLGNPCFMIVGAATGVLDALPLLGSGCVLLPWGAALLLAGDGARGIGYMALWGIAAAVRKFLEPKILGGQIGVSPALMLASVYLGFFAYGFWGFFLGPATVVALRCLYGEEEFS